MGQQQRRPGFLRWGESARGADGDASADAPVTAAEAAVDEAAASTVTAEATEQTSAEEAAPAAESAPAPGVAPALETPQSESPFLRDLVGAMRGVAESSRDATLTDLRSSVDARVEELKSQSGERAEELRRRSELDLGGIGDWERSELERVRAEAEERRKARRELLERELADHQAAADRDLEALRARLADYEREMDAFFAQLAEIDDPTAFVAAAKRMPPAPDLAATPAKGASPDAAKVSDSAPSQNGTAQPAGAADTLAERLAQLDERLGISTSAAPTPGPEAAAPSDTASSPSGVTATATATAPVSAPAPAAAETSTPIIVKGLGSFGAITSFKQALERVDGIRGVTLSLGPTGDFVYRASHAADFDLVGAIRSIEGPNAGIEEADGQLRVTIERPR